MIRFMLDTNIVSKAARDPRGPAATALARAGGNAVAVSIVVACELRFGLAKLEQLAHTHAGQGVSSLSLRVEQILQRIAVLPMDAPCDAHYGDIRATLERTGQSIGPNDLLIAAHARSLGLILVTNNTPEFSRVAGLQCADWSL
jgi:tRNA(fMet)-specific endonuclease VapC